MQRACSPPLRHTDVLYCIAKFNSGFHEGVTCTITADERYDKPDVITILCDRRIVRATGLWVHSDVLGKVLSFLSHSILGHHVKSIPIACRQCFGVAVNPSETLMAVVNHVHDDVEFRHKLYKVPPARTLGVGGVRSLP